MAGRRQTPETAGCCWRIPLAGGSEPRGRSQDGTFLGHLAGYGLLSAKRLIRLDGGSPRKARLAVQQLVEARACCEATCTASAPECLRIAPADTRPCAPWCKSAQSERCAAQPAGQCRFGIGLPVGLRNCPRMPSGIRLVTIDRRGQAGACPVWKGKYLDRHIPGGTRRHIFPELTHLQVCVLLSAG